MTVHVKLHSHGTRQVVTTFDDFAHAALVPVPVVWNSIDSNPWLPATMTVEPGEPSPSVISPDVIQATAWFKLTVTTGCVLQLSSSSRPSASLNAVVALYSGTSLGSLTEIASGYTSFTSPWLDPGVYYLQVGWDGPPPTTVFDETLDAFWVVIEPLPMPEFDDMVEDTWFIDLFGNPSTWADYGDGSPSIILTHATVSQGEPVPSAVSSIHHTAWLEWNPSASGTVTFDTSGSDAGLHEFVAVYAGTLGSEYADLIGHEVASSAASPASVTFPYTSGVYYYVQIGTQNETDAGGAQLNVTTS